MTAITIAAQPKYGCVHVAVDAAVYTSDQHVAAFRTKVFPIPHWPGLVTNTGNAGATILLGTHLSQMFQSFDEVVANADEHLPTMVTDCGLPTTAEVLLVGISEKRGPESYVFRTDDGFPVDGKSREEADASDYYAKQECTLLKLPDVIVTPVPHDQVIPAHFEGIDVEADPEMVIWSLRKHLEMQRQMLLPAGVGGIGGFAQVTTLSATGITQRMLQRWPEDQVGQRLRPDPIDWDEWHANNPMPVRLDRKTRRLSLVRGLR